MLLYLNFLDSSLESEVNSSGLELVVSKGNIIHLVMEFGLHCTGNGILAFVDLRIRATNGFIKNICGINYVFYVFYAFLLN